MNCINRDEVKSNVDKMKENGKNIGKIIEYLDKEYKISEKEFEEYCNKHAREWAGTNEQFYEEDYWNAEVQFLLDLKNQFIKSVLKTKTQEEKEYLNNIDISFRRQLANGKITIKYKSYEELEQTINVFKQKINKSNYELDNLSFDISFEGPTLTNTEKIKIKKSISDLYLSNSLSFDKKDLSQKDNKNNKQKNNDTFVVNQINKNKTQKIKRKLKIAKLKYYLSKKTTLLGVASVIGGFIIQGAMMVSFASSTMSAGLATALTMTTLTGFISLGVFLIENSDDLIKASKKNYENLLLEYEKSNNETDSLSNQKVKNKSIASETLSKKITNVKDNMIILLKEKLDSFNENNKKQKVTSINNIKDNESLKKFVTEDKIMLEINNFIDKVDISTIDNKDIFYNKTKEVIGEYVKRLKEVENMSKDKIKLSTDNKYKLEMDILKKITELEMELKEEIVRDNKEDKIDADKKFLEEKLQSVQRR